MTVLVCGEALYDVFFEAEREEGFTLDARIGGSAFNVAVGLARLGQPAGLLTGIAADVFGEKLAASLEAEGVDTRFLVSKEAPATLALVSLDEAGGAQYRFYGEGAADRQVLPIDAPTPGSVEAAVFGCFSILTKPTGDTFLAFARDVAAAGGLVVLDPNVRPTVEPDFSVWRARVEAFASHATLVKASAEDLKHLYPDEALADVAGMWLAQGCAAVVVTRGGDGAVLIRPGGSVSVPARDVAVVDTVGAGDSFLAAMIAALRATDAASREGIVALPEPVVRDVLSFAVDAAAVTCTRRGADLPRTGEFGTLS